MEFDRSLELREWNVVDDELTADLRLATWLEDGYWMYLSYLPTKTVKFLPDEITPAVFYCRLMTLHNCISFLYKHLDHQTEHHIDEA